MSSLSVLFLFSLFLFRLLLLSFASPSSSHQFERNNLWKKMNTMTMTVSFAVMTTVITIMATIVIDNGFWSLPFSLSLACATMLCGCGGRDGGSNRFYSSVLYQIIQTIRHKCCSVHAVSLLY